VCWELNVQEFEARPAFERAIADGLLARRGVDELHGEVMYALTDRGQRWLHGAS
jgi:DNA-binding PadR family transcriptional regulator